MPDRRPGLLTPQTATSKSIFTDSWIQYGKNGNFNSDSPSSATPRMQPPSAMFGTDYTRGYQKGNMFFTSTPPVTNPDEDEAPGSAKVASSLPPELIGRGLIHDSSGYGSDLLSPNSGGSLPRPFDRKCRSTCNITLSTNLQGG